MKNKIIGMLSFLFILSLGVYLHSVHFGNPFGVMKAKRKLTQQELIRAIRLMVAAEYEAVQLYTQLAESTDNTLAKKVLLEIADEERVHAGEFLKLLKQLAPDEEMHYKEGYKEVEKIMQKLKSDKSPPAQTEENF